MSRGILQLEMEELQWNRKMLMDHMGYRNYRDINAFLDILITNKHVTCQKDGKIEWFRSSGPGNIWLNAKKEGNNKLMQATGEPAAGDNISILIDRFTSNWCGRIPLEEEYNKFSRSFLKARVPWLTSDEFYLFGCNRRGNHLVFPGSTTPLNGWNPTSAGRTARNRYLSVDLEELLSQEV
jgi:hypothetical protein